MLSTPRKEAHIDQVSLYVALELDAVNKTIKKFSQKRLNSANSESSSSEAVSRNNSIKNKITPQF